MSKLIQRTVYFREEDIKLWEALSNKAEWLHIHLHADLTIPEGQMPPINSFLKDDPVVPLFRNPKKKKL